MADDAGKQQPPSLDEFSKRLDAARGESKSAEASRTGTGQSLGRAFRVASELLAALFVGGLLGLGLDRVLATSPLFLLIGLGVGFAAGVLNVSRAMKAMNKAQSGDG
jgi:ATP synthase protein I